MDFAITFLEGVITFVSPCLLPMLPIYVAYFAGGAERANNGSSSLGRTLVCAFGFVVGFTIVFTLMGALAGAAGHLLFEYQGVLNAICGIIVIILGLNYLGVMRIPLLQRTLKPSAGVMPRGFWSSLVFGMVFVDFNVVWRYFAWTNQTLAVFTLWAGTIWLFKKSLIKNEKLKIKNYRYGYLIALIPALFMTMVCSSYILIAPEGLHIAPDKRIIGYVIAGLATLGCLFGFIVWAKRQKNTGLTK